MTTVSMLDVVRRVRRSLILQIRIRALVLALGAALSVWLVLDGMRIVLGHTAVPTAMAVWLVGITFVGVALVALLVARRVARHVDDARAALWIEERSTAGVHNSFALVTLIESLSAGASVVASAVPTTVSGDALTTSAQTILARIALPVALRASARRQLTGPALFAAGAFVVLLAGAVWRDDALTASRLDSTRGSPSAMRAADTAFGMAPLGSWTVRITPPAYTGQPAWALGNVQSVAAVSGSVVVVEGAGVAPMHVVERLLGEAADTLPVAQRTSTLVATSSADRWQLRTVARALPVAVQLSRGGRIRQLLIEGRPDSIPAVALVQPARDSVFRTAEGRLPLVATLRDDIGLADARFELIVSSGEGERFTARTMVLGSRRLRGATTGTIRETLDLAALKLMGGDVVHVRAIARDAYPVSAREFGSSETRSFRIARAAEYDSVAVEPAPPPEVDRSLMSQRMLLMLTEKLNRQRTTLTRAQLVRESMKLARDQARLRQAVGDVVFQRLSGDASGEHAHTAGDGHDHGVEQQQGKLALTGSNAGGVLSEGDDSPIIAINQPLLEAYNAMWDAGRELEQGAPKAAMPHMRLALAAIERARSAERLYLRGRPPTVIVDIAKIRLAGKDTGITNTRTRRMLIPPRDAARTARLIAAAQLIERDAAAARDTLAVLRVEALADAPVFAAAVGRVLDVLAQGGDLTPAFLSARRALGGVLRTEAGVWSREVPR